LRPRAIPSFKGDVPVFFLRSALVPAATLVLMLIAQAASAEGYPSRPIHLIVPFPPGGTTDIVARVVADRVGQELGQPLVLENRGGAGGSIGALAIAKSTPDGYTIGIATVSTHGTNPATSSKLGYDPIKDFIAITNLAAVPNVLEVHPSVKAQNLAEFIKLLRAEPGKYSFASSGIGGISHMMGELFEASTKTSMVHIPYRGAGPAINDVIAGQVPVLFDNLPSSLPHIQGGRMRALAVAAPQRLDSLPGVPTFAEAGLKEVNDEAWYGIVAPAHTADDAVQKIYRASVKALAAPDVIEHLRQQGASPVGNSPAQFGAQIRDEFEKWKRVVRERGIKLE
jgi:tripartite-type tricarboxylate transporter receptor subunit TctC